MPQEIFIFMSKPFFLIARYTVLRVSTQVVDYYCKLNCKILFSITYHRDFYGKCHRKKITKYDYKALNAVRKILV